MEKEELFQNLYLAAFQEDLVTCNTFIANGADVNWRNVNDANKTLLHYMIEEGKQLVVEYLLQNSAELDVKDEKGNTPLHAAAEKMSIRNYPIIS